MKNKITKEEIKYLAELSRVGLTDSEIKRYQKDLADILAYVDKLNEVDTDKVMLTSHIMGLKNITREDKIKKSEISRNEILKNAPEKEDGYIKVKSVFD